LRVSATKFGIQPTKNIVFQHENLEFTTYWDLTNRIEDFTTTGDVSDAGRGVSEAKVVDSWERWDCLKMVYH
jgi:hypothetical protein